LNVIQWQVLWNLNQFVSRVKALLTIGADWGKAGANSFADGEPGDARTQLLDLANSFETDDNRRIADDHRVRDTCPMVRISEIHADGRAAKTYLATHGRPDLDLLPHEIVGCAFLVDYRRHSHDAFLLLLSSGEVTDALDHCNLELARTVLLAVRRGLRVLGRFVAGDPFSKLLDDDEAVEFLPAIVAARVSVVPRKQFGLCRTVFD
jgi:hypothetical protein